MALNGKNRSLLTTLSSREFNQNASRARHASLQGPVVITDRGRPAHVLLSIEEYRRLTAQPSSLVQALSMPGLAEIDFDPPKLSISISPADLS